jgi:transcriptional regulator with XRE-family HTH domain
LTGEELRSWRITLGFTQEDAAAELGYTRATIQNWERSVTRVPLCVDLASKQIRRRRSLPLDFGPVTLIFSNMPLWLNENGSDVRLIGRRCNDVKAALDLINELESSSRVSDLMLVDETNRLIHGARELSQFASFAKAGRGSMDSWSLKKWRKQHGLNQFEAAAKLGIHRAGLQNWEREIRPISRAVELACAEITKSEAQNLNYGPVLLLMIALAIFPATAEAFPIAPFHCKRYSNTNEAIEQANLLGFDSLTIASVILLEDGTVVLNRDELFSRIRSA